jgi:hypothetical protein
MRFKWQNFLHKSNGLMQSFLKGLIVQLWLYPGTLEDVFPVELISLDLGSSFRKICRYVCRRTDQLANRTYRRDLTNQISKDRT